MDTIFMLFMAPVTVFKHIFGSFKLSTAANGTGFGDAMMISTCYFITIVEFIIAGIILAIVF